MDAPNITIENHAYTTEQAVHGRVRPLLRNAAKAVTRWVLRACAALGTAFLLVSITPVGAWYGHRLAGSFDDPPGDVLVVLGGGIDEGILSHDSLLRAKYAVKAYREGGFKHVVISGSG